MQPKPQAARRRRRLADSVRLLKDDGPYDLDGLGPADIDGGLIAGQ
jgi:hypothetical protein